MNEKPDGPVDQIPASVLRLLTAIGAAGLFAFGVFCWIAANWSTFHRLTKIGLVGGLLLAAALAAALAPRARTACLLVATSAVGGLLALIGQTYPSGADAWQLFAYWAALGLPFALAARHDAVWLLWTLVVGAAIGLWRMQEHMGVSFNEFAPSWALSLAVAAALSPFLPFQRLIGRTPWSFRLASLGAVLLISFIGLEGLFARANQGDGALFAALLVLGASSAGLIVARPLELGVLTMSFAGIDALLIGRVFKAFESSSFTIPIALFIGVIASAIVGGSVALLRAIHARATGGIEGEDRRTGAPDQRGFSWPLAALSGFGAMLASAPFLILYGLVFESFLRQPGGAAFLGAATLGAAALLVRGAAPFSFRQMFGLIAIGVGIALISYAAARWYQRDAGFVMALVAAVVAFAIQSNWMRALFGFGAFSALVSSIFAHVAVAFFIRGTGWRIEMAVALTSLTAAAGVAALVATSKAGSRGEAARPFFAGWTAAGLLALIALAGRPFLASAGAGGLGELASLFTTPWSGPAQATSIALGVIGVAILLARRADLRTPLGFAVAICVVALTLRSPTLGATVAVFAGAVLAGSRSLAAAAAVATIWIVSAFYYALNWPLTQKGYVLMGLGAALGVVVFLTRARGAAAHNGPTVFGRAAVALIALGAAVTAGIASTAVRDAENVLRDGRIVYIALRPVDPRSLVQGDYMAIAFNTDRLPAPREATGEVRALADIDARSVLTLQSLTEPGAAPAADQVVVKLRRKSGRWFVGSDAFFFEEGHAHDYVDAKYGQFRLGADGRLLLTRLADKDLRLLP